MSNTNETSLQVIQNQNILVKIMNFFKKLLKKSTDMKITQQNILDNKQTSKNDFLKSLKIDEDPDRKKLLKIQIDLEKRGINEKNVIELTKDLTPTQKQKLELLYREQITEYEASTQSYKRRIVAIRKQLAKSN